MMQKRDFDETVECILAQDSRYHANAYALVRDALDFTMKHGAKDGGHGHHVSGQELLDGFRRFSLREFGPMAPTVFEEWGITCCRDIGEMVFNLIEAGIFGKTDSDTIEDFDGRYDFEEAFVHPFLPKAKLNTAPVSTANLHSDSASA